MTASQIDIPHADDANSQVIYQTPSAPSPVSTPSAKGTPEEVAASASQERRYSPIISYLGGRKFVLVVIGITANLILIAGVVAWYDPTMADEQIRLIETGAKSIAGLVGLFVGGNTAQRFAQRRSRPE